MIELCDESRSAGDLQCRRRKMAPGWTDFRAGCAACLRWCSRRPGRGCRRSRISALLAEPNGVLAQPDGEQAQGTQAAPVAAGVQLDMQPLGAADPFVPSPPQGRPGRVRRAPEIIWSAVAVAAVA